MFIDYLGLLLINMSAGFMILAAFLYKGLNEAGRKDWTPAFAITGLVALACGLHMIWHWPLPGAYNSAYGEMSVLFGVIFIGAALAVSMDRGFIPLGIYSAFAGAAAVVLGARIIDLKMTNEPLISGIGFILSGLSGIFVIPVVFCRKKKAVIIACAAILAVTSLLWARTGLMAYWGHMEAFSKWQPK